MALDNLLLFEKHLGEGKRCGNVWAFHCWRCDQGKRSRHLYVNSEGLYYCHKCATAPDGLGQGNAVKFARIMRDSPGGSYSLYKRETAISRFDQGVALDVYTHLFNEAGLTREHRDKLAERGIKSPYSKFGLRSSNGAIKILSKKFDEPALISCGLLCTDGGKTFTHRSVYNNRILIPYWVDGKVWYFRSRGVVTSGDYLGPYDVSSNNYFWGFVNPDRKCDLIITEGEFKAMAAVQAGFHCVGLPGMNSAHDIVAKVCKEKGIQESTILFDSQIRNNKYVDYAAYSLGEKLSAAGIKVYRAFLPLYEESKIDIDSFLLSHSREELVDVLLEAKRL